MPRLSIVIPALGAWEQLEATLVSVLANRPSDTEIVVALDDGYGDPYGLEGEVRFVRLPPTATTVDAWNAGIAACQGPVVHLLACGATVGEGWCDAAIRHFDDRCIAAVAPLVTNSDEQYTHTAGWRYSVGGVASHFAAGQPAASVGEPDDRWLGPHGAAAFYRRSAVASAPAAFDRSFGEAVAPLDLALRLRHAGYRSVFEPHCRVIVAELPGGGIDHSIAEAERLFWRHAADEGAWQAATAHLGAIALEFARAFPHPRCVRQLAQRFQGLIHSRRSACAAYRLASYAGEAKPEASSSSHRVDPSHGRIARGTTRRANIAEQMAAPPKAP